jgi:regulator of RNase E activity RraA
MNRQIKAAFPEMPPMVGFASTATCRTFLKPGNKDGYTALADQVARFEELSGDVVVVFQDLDEAAAAATFGEIMCSTYQAFGAVGLVTSGPGRDLDQVRQIGFPVFTDGAVCSHGYIHILQAHIPVHVGGLSVYPDDLLHGDLNGVTSIPREIASELADACPEFIAAEKVMIDLVQQGKPTVAQLREAAAEKNRLTAILKRRLTGA